MAFFFSLLATVLAATKAPVESYMITTRPPHDATKKVPPTPRRRQQQHFDLSLPLLVSSVQRRRTDRNARLLVPLRSGDSVTHGADDEPTSASSPGGCIGKKRLQDCVCLVTGASRGIGKGIALELGEQGAVVYVTGTTTSTTSSNANENAFEEEEPGTIEETARMVTAAGGTGIAVRCDHGIDAEVKDLFERISAECGRLDILVNNAFRLPAGGASRLFAPFWEQGADVWDCLFHIGPRSHYVATCHAMPLLRKACVEKPNLLPRPLVVMISSFGGLTYSFNVPYGVAKAAVDRMVKDMAVDMSDDDICVVSLWPGVVMTERTEITVRNGDWDRYVGLPLDNAESPRFTGRAVVAVATDTHNKMRYSGTCQVVAELAAEYDFVDVTGKRPPSIRSLRFLIPSYVLTDQQRKSLPDWLIPDWKLPFWVMAQGENPKKEQPEEAQKGEENSQ